MSLFQKEVSPDALGLLDFVVSLELREPSSLGQVRARVVAGQDCDLVLVVDAEVLELERVRDLRVDIRIRNVRANGDDLVPVLVLDNAVDLRAVGADQSVKAVLRRLLGHRVEHNQGVFLLVLDNYLAERRTDR